MLSQVIIYNYKFVNIDKHIQANHKYISKKINALYIYDINIKEVLYTTPDNSIIICLNNFVYFNTDDVIKYLNIKFDNQDTDIVWPTNTNKPLSLTPVCFINNNKNKNIIKLYYDNECYNVKHFIDFKLNKKITNKFKFDELLCDQNNKSILFDGSNIAFDNFQKFLLNKNERFGILT